jgi:hypothetical protein
MFVIVFYYVASICENIIRLTIPGRYVSIHVSILIFPMQDLKNFLHLQLILKSS